MMSQVRRAHYTFIIIFNNIINFWMESLLALLLLIYKFFLGIFSRERAQSPLLHILTYLISLTLRWLEFKHADSLPACNAGVQSPPVCWLELQAGISQAGWRVVSLDPHLQGKQYIAGVERKLKTKVQMINYPS